jgi:hypothetical protein
VIPPLPDPSHRLVRAATAEQAELASVRARLVHERERLLGELREVDGALAAIDQRQGVLTQLLGIPGSADSDDASARDPADEPLAPVTRPDLLRGPAIREAAVQVLISRPEQIEAIHYRRWYELLLEAGYDVAGKDPLAVFLTQVTRSPLVRKATEAGVYELDRQVPLRLRRRLEQLQAELRESTLSSSAPIDLAEVRARRHELDLSISRHERALDEALRCLRRDPPAEQSRRAGAR